ncbi:MAG: HAD family phosphatase [Planctomycetaceae bacterium]|nr:HAD family phosphatase [Planctomycetaceae bacterium]
MSKIKLLALDVDGTLVNSRDELTSATRDALRRAAEAGVQIVLATGRRYSRTLPLVEPLGIDAPLVTASGALIKRPSDHHTLYRAEFAPGVLRKTLQVVAAAGFDAVLYGDTYGEGFDFYCPRGEVPDQPELGEYFMLNAQCERVLPTLMEAPPPHIFAGFAAGSRDAMLALDEQLQAALPGKLYTHVIRSPRYRGHMCEIAPIGITKWFGISHLAQQWGITADEICAVGDDVNDIPMIEGAGLGVAMGNAVAETKAVADRIAPHHDEDGLVEVVNWVLAQS